MKSNARQKGCWTPVLTISAAVFLLAASMQSATAQKKVYRWVDEEGNVHYSESLPPDWQGEAHDEISHQGIVTDQNVSRIPEPPEPETEPDPDLTSGKTPLPTDKSGLPRPEPLYTDAEKQARMDRLLMLRYKSEEELVDAMQLEINQLKYDEELLNATRESLRSSLRSNIELAGHRQRAGLPVKPETLDEIARTRSRLDDNERSLHGLKVREENIRADFTRDLERYRKLVEMYSEEQTG